MLLRRLAPIAALALVVVPLARADADPASDILYTNKIYLPFFGAKVSQAHADALKKTVDAAWKKGYPVKVALIATRNDLGGVFQLWQKPQTYADFLGRELVFLYKGVLLTAMPNGMGVYKYKDPVTQQKALVKTVKVQPDADGLADSANIAVAKLAGLPPPKLPSGGGGGGGSGGTPIWQLIVIIVGGLAIVGAMVYFGPRAYRKRKS